jgi:N-methylhydantoinase A
MEIEILSWTLALNAPVDDQQILAGRVADAGDAAIGEATIYGVDGTELAVEVPVYRRDALSVATKLSGPLLVVEEQTTTVVPAGVDIQVLQDGTMSLDFVD